MKSLRTLLALVVAGMATPAARADPVVVEVILFRYDAAAEASQWPQAASLPSFSGARPLEDPGSAPGEGWYSSLPPSSLRLAGSANALRRSGGREVLLHAAWRQPSAEGTVVYLKAPAADPSGTPALEGSLAVHEAGRELRVSGDFLLAVGSARVLVHADQKFRATELRYVDHALLGLLVQVSPAAVPAGPGVGEVGDAPPAAATRPQQGPAD